MITVSYEKLFLNPCCAAQAPSISATTPCISRWPLSCPQRPSESPWAHWSQVRSLWRDVHHHRSDLGFWRVCLDFNGYFMGCLKILWDFDGSSFVDVSWNLPLTLGLRLVFDGFCLSIRPRMGSRWRQLRRVLRPFPSFLREWRHHWADESAPDCGQSGWVQDKGRPADVEFVVWVPSAIQTCIK